MLRSRLVVLVGALVTGAALLQPAVAAAEGGVRWLPGRPRLT